MRRLITAGVLAALVVGACVIGTLFINRAGADIGAPLEAAIEAAEAGDAEKAREQSLRAEKAFVAAEGKISFFIDHSLAEELGLQLAKLRGLAEDDSLEEFAAAANGALTMLNHIVNDEKPTWLNVF